MWLRRARPRPASSRTCCAIGAKLQLCEPTQAARQAAAEQIIAATGATLIHPFDNADVMAGQGTVALELLEQVPELAAIVCPIGGGGSDQRRRCRRPWRESADPDLRRRARRRG